MNEETIEYRVLMHLQSKVKHDIPLEESNFSLITALRNQGYTETDMLRVIDKKAKDWLGTKFEVFLRPQTLFGSKFTKYHSYERRISATRVEKLINAVQSAKRTYWRLDKK